MKSRTTTTSQSSRTTILLLGLVGFAIGMVLLIVLNSTPAPTGLSYYRDCTEGRYVVGREIYYWECR